MDQFNRRNFLKFLGYSTAGLYGLKYLSSCSSPEVYLHDYSQFDRLVGILPTSEDAVVLANGLKYRILLKDGDPINDHEAFGAHADYIDYKVIGENEMIMWVNHEYMNPLFIGGEERTRANISREMDAVGGSILHLKKNAEGWKLQKKSKYNRRLTAKTSIPFSNGHRVWGSLSAVGTLANCAGGQTPWNTFLTCEENWYYFYGDRDSKGKKVKDSYFSWHDFHNNPPEHYGWVVEVVPETGKAVKLVELGRFSHESATTVMSSRGVVVYMGDDQNGGCFYKFVSDSKENLKSGTLYVANLEKGEWLALDVNKNKQLKKAFKNQLELLTFTREAAAIVGGTPLDRPEDVEIHPFTGDIFLSLTSNTKVGNYHGSIVKFREKGADYGGTRFDHETFLMGGTKHGFSNPDNIAFDRKGNFWFATDVLGTDIGKGEYAPYKNNGLFVVPAGGKNRGKVIQVASAPMMAEFTGPKFAPDGKSMFVAVQHPGEFSKDAKNPLSHWPTGKGIPKSAIIEITGDLIS